MNNEMLSSHLRRRVAVVSSIAFRTLPAGLFCLIVGDGQRLRPRDLLTGGRCVIEGVLST